MSPETHAAAPNYARDPEQPFYVRWGFVEPGQDPFTAGALWAGYSALEALLGDFLGGLAAEAQLLERWDPAAQEWRLVA